MHRFKKLFMTGLKISTITIATTSVASFGYLQYINTVLGPIDLRYDEAISFYKDKYKMSDSKALMTYYFALWNLSLSRVINYRNYLWYC